MSKKIANEPKTKNKKTVEARSFQRYPNQLDVTQLLADVQQKLNNSQVFNGGFDTLLYKVDKIEESQGKIVQTVASIHDAIYDPDTGLFSRIATVKASHVEDRTELDKKITELNSWKNHVDKITADNHVGDDELQKKIDAQQKTIESLERWKSNVSSIGKWSSVTIGGGVVTILLKALYDLLIAK